MINKNRFVLQILFTLVFSVSLRANWNVIPYFPGKELKDNQYLLCKNSSGKFSGLNKFQLTAIEQILSLIFELEGDENQDQCERQIISILESRNAFDKVNVWNSNTIKFYVVNFSSAEDLKDTISGILKEYNIECKIYSDPELKRQISQMVLSIVFGRDLKSLPLDLDLLKFLALNDKMIQAYIDAQIKMLPTRKDRLLEKEKSDEERKSIESLFEEKEVALSSLLKNIKT